MSSLKRTACSYTIVALNCSSLLLLWLSLFSQIDWLSQIDVAASPYVVNLKNDGYTYISKLSYNLEGVSLWRFRLDGFSGVVSSYGENKNYVAFKPREPQMEYGVSWLTVGSILPLVHVALLSAQLMNVYSLSRALDVVQFWVSVASVFTNGVGFGVTFDYLHRSFVYRTSGPSFYLEIVAVSLLFISLLVSAVRISTSSPHNGAHQRSPSGVKMREKSMNRSQTSLEKRSYYEPTDAHYNQRPSPMYTR